MCDTVLLLDMFKYIASFQGGTEVNIKLFPGTKQAL